MIIDESIKQWRHLSDVDSAKESCLWSNFFVSPFEIFYIMIHCGTILSTFENYMVSCTTKEFVCGL